MDGLSGIQVSPVLHVPERELRWRFSRSSGPGGQGVNTTDSRVELSLDVAASPSLSTVQRDRALERLADRLVGGVLTVAVAEHREQLRNRAVARSRLAGLLAAAVAPPGPRRRATRATLASRRRRLETKARRGELKRSRRATE